MPDVVLYSEENDWIYFVEAVTSVGAMDPKRIKEISLFCFRVYLFCVKFNCYRIFPKY